MIDKTEHTPMYGEPLSNLPNYDPEPADGMRVGESPVPGITLKRILRAHTGVINRLSWSSDGKMLVTPSADNTIGIWDVEKGEMIHILEGHQSKVYCAEWLRNDEILATGAWDGSIRLWDVTTGERICVLSGELTNALAWIPDRQLLAVGNESTAAALWDIRSETIVGYLSSHRGNINNLTLSHNGRFLSGACGDRSVRIWDLESHEMIRILSGHSDWVFDSSWSPDDRLLYSCSWDSTVRVWNVGSGMQKSIFQSHLGKVCSCSASPDALLLATKSHDNSVRIWNLTTFQTVVSFTEQSSFRNSPGLAFHPHQSRLATLGERDTVVRIWDIDMDVLLSQTATEAVRYTTAKIVLVGDSGVGKTGLGWRLAHGEFKQHASTHGQQFWIVDELGITRKDGTECEAVLWDLAGQHVYRAVHSIFLDNVDASLILFDPANRHEPLKGVQFWLEQLKVKGQLPPSVLVGARVDRGAPSLSLDDLTRFCQHYGISGGFISTSAMTGEGLDALIELLKDQIPWEEMTTTVTTRTFKRVREHVFTLKENLVLVEEVDDRSILVTPKELRDQLEDTDSEWEFTDAEMMTAVSHLETHGHITVLENSSGETFILLIPELLANLASFIVLLADKHPHELGAINETELLQGHHIFDELEGLDETEQQALLDAAVLRFLRHNVCFRETFDGDTLLIFPGLIKQKRPLVDDFAATDDVSYVVRGRVENLYAMLVVLLGYTSSFVRINQWQNQAQYEMGQDQICGFRMIADREGEIELVLYYSERMPQSGRDQFQELFERFLYQRDVDVTRFPPVVCPKGHRLERTTVISLVRENETSAFCPKCGGKVDLPNLEKRTIGTGVSKWLQREEAVSRLRSTYEQHLTRVKGYRRGWATPRCYVSHALGQEDQAVDLIHDLKDAGVYIIAEAAQVQTDDYIVMMDTPNYQRDFSNPVPAFEADIDLVRERLAGNSQRLIAIKLDGKPASAPDHNLANCTPGDFCDLTHYPVSLFDLVLNLYAIPLEHASFAPLRASLHEQWERMPKEEVFRDSEEQEEKEEKGVSPRMEHYVDFDLHIGPDGHAIATSNQGQATADISTMIPSNIRLSLKLIERRAADTDLLKDVGLELYGWLFPGTIHTHFHQTEAVAREKGSKIRLRLRVEAESIASLPLEFIYRETGGYFVATNPDTVLSRYLNIPMPPGYVRRREGPMHMLAIIADPIDQVRLPPDEWEGILEEALAKPLKEGQMTLQTVKRATRKEIRNALLQQKPDIIQFVGHGIYQNGKGYLALVDNATDRTWFVDDEQFAGLFLGYTDHLGLISLATCESAKSDDPQGFLGIAPKLVQRGIPAVLAMQYKVYVKTAKVFLEDFYTAVAAREPIDWSTQSARNAVSLEFGLDNREFATPVLYMRAKDGRVF